MPQVDWKVYFDALGITVDSLSIGQIPHLQEAGRMLDDEPLEDLKTLVMTVNHDEHFLRIHDGAYTYGEGCLRHFIDIIVEETAVGDNGVGRQLFLTRAAGKRRTRFVERDMSVRADTAEEQMNTAELLDLRLITCALGLQVRSITVKDMYG